MLSLLSLHLPPFILMEASAFHESEFAFFVFLISWTLIKESSSHSLPFLFCIYQSLKMFQLLKSFSVAILAMTATLQAYPDPRSCTGYCWAHDPAVIQRESDGLYFKFNTGTGIQYATSTSLDGSWTIQGYVLLDGSSIDNAGSDDPWVWE